jgi:hypothetical protein
MLRCGGKKMAELKKSPPKSSTERAYKPFLDAYNVYCYDITSAGWDIQQRYQKLNSEHQAPMIRAWQSQSQKDIEAAQEEYRRAFQSVSTEVEPAKRYADACLKYLKSVQQALAGVNLDTLDATSLVAIGQSLCLAGQLANQLSCASSLPSSPPSGSQ